MWSKMSVLIIIAIVLTRFHRNTAVHPMCHDVYNIGPDTETGGQAVVHFNVATDAEPRVAIKTFTTDYHHAMPIEHTVLATLTEKQSKDGGDTWLPKLYDSCLMPGNECPSTVMEFVDKPFAFANTTRLYELVDILHQLLWAVARLHDLGYSHNDLKPDNIRITETGLVKLIDFGVAANISKPFDIDFIAGTPVYMPPEATRRIIEEIRYANRVTLHFSKSFSPIDTARLDSWPLGVISFHIFTHTRIDDEKEVSEVIQCLYNEKYSPEEQEALIDLGMYFYVKEVLMGQTNRSVDENELTKVLTIIDECQKFRNPATVENRFTSQLSERFAETKQPRGNLQKNVVALWKLVDSLLQFENSARSNVRDALENPVFESFIRPWYRQEILSYREEVLSIK